MSSSREMIGHGSFTISLFGGCIMTPLSIIVVRYAHGFLVRNLGDSILTMHITVALLFFCGGFCAGHMFEPDLRAVRSRFFPLVFVSPATPVWVFSVTALAYGVEFPPWLYGVVLIACISAVAGSLTGYRFARWLVSQSFEEARGEGSRGECREPQ